MEYIVDLEAFHGPLDLLLYLIDKNEVDLYDIPVAVITDQYMEHIHHTGDYNLEVMGDFLIMASFLLNLKSRLLLPQREQMVEEEEESVDPRQELVQKLLDYRRYKQAAEFLQDRESGKEQRPFFRQAVYKWDEPEEIIASINALVRAYRLISRKETGHKSYDLNLTDIDIDAKMTEIIYWLERRHQGAAFQDIWQTRETREQLALFLALLELVRQQKVTVQQDCEFGEIMLFLRVGS
jgi:segregation and condensation protein A